MSALLRVSLRQLEYFVAVGTLGTMGAAAGECQVSQSAISLAVSDLERALDVQLFLRQKAKRLQLTAAGRQVLGDARRLLAQAEELQSTARSLGGDATGQLVVGCFPSLSSYVMPTVLDALAREHPGMDVQFAEGSVAELQGWLHDGTCEVAVMYGMGVDPSLETTDLYLVRPHVELATDHPLAARRKVRLANLADEPMILLDVPPSEQLFRGVLAEAGVTPKIARRVVSVDGVRALVATGRGYTVLLQRPIVAASPIGLEVAVCEIVEPVSPVAVQLVRAAATRSTRRAEAFSDVCRRYLHEGARRTGIAD
ncbi:LysR family transcriptional regulator [Sporichthya sp.]|uniref:LysR family transcriptional regulator n=1 Tax=Sporichthya sp. TaxID=65475 RepID=UPI0017B4D73B|nr:LysR family transcriptional regulator [Sporichthya sp.]MBA3743660.1 LysR family transcriptional regulator [Sporichthya sp.]